MAYFQRVWAHIDPEGIVRNRIVCDDYETANQLARIVYGDGSIAVEINNWAVAEGDKYEDGAFYDSEGNARERIPEVENQVSELKRTVSESSDDLTNTQLAITELYEAMTGGTT